jgi:quinol monooxygenase YgiN
MRFIRRLRSARSCAAFRRWAVVPFLVLATIAVIPAARAQSGADAVYAVTYLDVGTTSVAQGIELIKKFRDASRREAANLEFTILQEMSRPNRFAIVEGWKDRAAFDAYDKGTAKAEFVDALKPIRNSPPARFVVQSFANAPARTVHAGALYMVEHVDFRGGDPAIAIAAAPLVKALAESSQKESGAIRYEIYRQPPPRINHYQVVSVWPDAKAFEAHEIAAHTMQFRAATAQGGPAWRVNLYDQRLYKAL